MYTSVACRTSFILEAKQNIKNPPIQNIDVLHLFFTAKQL